MFKLYTDFREEKLRFLHQFVIKRCQIYHKYYIYNWFPPWNRWIIAFVLHSLKISQGLTRRDDLYGEVCITCIDDKVLMFNVIWPFRHLESFYSTEICAILTEILQKMSLKTMPFSLCYKSLYIFHFSFILHTTTT